MRRRTIMKEIKLIFLVVLYLLGNTVVSPAAVVGPYKVDDYTYHLWHFDGLTINNTIDDEVATNPIPLTLEGTATIEVASATGFGSALQTGNGSYASGGIQPISNVVWTGFSGALTFEAIIRPDVDPLAPPNNM
jgi:hypothetical protein